jgi:hypothetical protein
MFSYKFNETSLILDMCNREGWSGGRDRGRLLDRMACLGLSTEV